MTNDEYNLKRLATCLEQLRHAEGYSRKEAADLSGVHAQFIYTLEREPRENTSYNLLTTYATKVYDLSPDQLASLAGLWTLPPFEYQPPMPKILQDLRTLITKLNPEERLTLTSMLEVYIDHQQQIHGITLDTDDSHNDTPTWFSQKIESIKQRRSRTTN